jgi:hypothetical protein
MRDEGATCHTLPKSKSQGKLLLGQPDKFSIFRQNTIAFSDVLFHQAHENTNGMDVDS